MLVILKACQISVHHLHDQLLKTRFSNPPQPLVSFLRIAVEHTNLSRAHEPFIDHDMLFCDQADVCKRKSAELADGDRPPGGDDIIIRFVLLQHEPHGFHIVTRVAPIAFCV